MRFSIFTPATIPRLALEPPATASAATMSQEAVDLKNKGNKEFAAGDYPGAVTYYSKAIALNDKEPTFFTNRAQVRRRVSPALVCSCD